jgi:hypothetical protein
VAAVLARAEPAADRASTADTKVAGDPSAGVPAAREPHSRAVTQSSPESSQKDTADADEAADSVVAVRPARLPRFYAQLELTDEQKQQVLLIQQQYGQREAELQRQLETLLSERDAKTKQVLTRSQQRKLNQLQAERGT